MLTTHKSLRWVASNQESVTTCNALNLVKEAVNALYMSGLLVVVTIAWQCTCLDCCHMIMYFPFCRNAMKIKVMALNLTILQDIWSNWPMWISSLSLSTLIFSMLKAPCVYHSRHITSLYNKSEGNAIIETLSHSQWSLFSDVLNLL